VAGDEGTLVNQKRPENQWIFHPDLDACTPDGPIL
jgi:hypothetical protein